MYPFIPRISKSITPVVDEQFLSYTEIQKISNLLQNIPYERGSVMLKNEVNTFDETEMRRSNVKWIPQTTEWSWLYYIIRDKVDIINKNTWNFDLTSIIENIQYTEYRGDEKGHYDWHIDIGNDIITNCRKVSISILLSSPDEYEGGELLVNDGGSIDDSYSSPKKLGSAVIFPSYLLHKVNPITKGIRRSLVLWMGGSTFK